MSKPAEDVMPHTLDILSYPNSFYIAKPNSRCSATFLIPDTSFDPFVNIKDELANLHKIHFLMPCISITNPYE
jgi:hypothetical protein